MIDLATPSALERCCVLNDVLKALDRLRHKWAVSSRPLGGEDNNDDKSPFRFICSASTRKWLRVTMLSVHSITRSINIVC
jgi:hypothetical protein